MILLEIFSIDGRTILKPQVHECIDSSDPFGAGTPTGGGGGGGFPGGGGHMAGAAFGGAFGGPGEIPGVGNDAKKVRFNNGLGWSADRLGVKSILSARYGSKGHFFLVLVVLSGPGGWTP